MNHRPRRVTNSHLAATSVVRLIEVMKPPEPDEPPNLILKSVPKKRLPGTKLMIKLAKKREQEKEKRAARRATIDDAAVDEAIRGIIEDLAR